MPPVTAPPAWCLCGHSDDEHGSNGRCRAKVGGKPCGCRDFEEE